MLTRNQIKTRLKLCRKFDEGTEITDCVHLMCDVVDNLYNLGYHTDAEIVLIVTESICGDYILYLFNHGSDWSEFDKIPTELYKYFTGREKLTKKEFEAQLD